MGERFAKSPLLYIHQPTVQNPKAVMQDNYTTPKRQRNTVTNEDQPNKPVQSRPIKRSSFVQKEALNIKEPDNKTHEVENDFRENEIKEEGDSKFRDLTIREKVDYFVNMPSHVPKIKCELKTDEQTFRGIITDSLDEFVFMRVGRRSSSTKIPIDDIKNIRMLGF